MNVANEFVRRERVKLHSYSKSFVFHSSSVVRLFGEYWEADHRYAVIDRLILTAVTTMSDEYFHGRMSQEITLRKPTTYHHILRYVDALRIVKPENKTITVSAQYTKRIKQFLYHVLWKDRRHGSEADDDGAVEGSFDERGEFRG